MKRSLILLVAMALGVLAVRELAPPSISLEQLEGAGWSDPRNPTADFGIAGDQVWLDQDSDYHPVRVDRDLLIFDLGPALGEARHRIVSLTGDTLVLESAMTGERSTLRRVRE